MQTSEQQNRPWPGNGDLTFLWCQQAFQPQLLSKVRVVCTSCSGVHLNKIKREREREKQLKSQLSHLKP